MQLVFLNFVVFIIARYNG